MSRPALRALALFLLLVGGLFGVARPASASPASAKSPCTMPCCARPAPPMACCATETKALHAASGRAMASCDCVAPAPSPRGSAPAGPDRAISVLAQALPAPAVAWPSLRAPPVRRIAANAIPIPRDPPPGGESERGPPRG